MLCDPTDGVTIGEPYCTPAEDIESMTHYQLETLAYEQGKLLRSRLWDRATVQRYLSEVVKDRMLI